MIENIILETVKKHNLIKPNQTVTVALSGGADSMALLFALLRLKEKLGISVEAAHLNHLIRGEEAFRDENFVKEECLKLGVTLYTERIDVPKIAKEKSQSLELAARNLRYEFLKRVSKDVIATAHNADDNLETLLLNLTRGTSIDGLCGIPLKRDIFIRPLLFCTREMIENYCKENSIPFITDSTNLCDDYSRNKIRHNVIPTLKEINPSVEAATLRTCISLKEISNEIKCEAEEYLKENISDGRLDIKNLGEIKKSVAKRVIINFVKLCNADISLETCHIEEIMKICQKGGKTSLPYDKSAVNYDGYLKIVPSKPEKNTAEYQVEIIKTDKNTHKVNNLFLNNSFDCDKITGELVVRTRRAGDSVRLKNRGCTKSLAKLFNESHIPLEERDVIPVIADDKGIVWIYKTGVAARCAVTENSNHIYCVNVNIKER